MARIIKDLETPEGATPIHDCSGLKLSWIATQEELNRAETENIMAAQKKYLRIPVPSPSKWFDNITLKKIHKEMFGFVWEWAGIFRKQTTNIGSHPHLIPSMLAQLCDDVQSWSIEPVELSFLERAARIHHRLVSIHPFENGNGRFSRLISDRYLLFWDCQHPVWPIDLEKEGTARADYLKSLRCADKGDFELLNNFMINLGAQEPSLKKLQSSAYFKNKLSSLQKQALGKAYARLGYPGPAVEKTMI